MCGRQGISLVVKIKTTSGESVFCCFRARGERKSLLIDGRQGLCVCLPWRLRRGLSPRTRKAPAREGCSGNGALGWGRGALSVAPCAGTAAGLPPLAPPTPPKRALPSAGAFALRASAGEPMPSGCARTLGRKQGCGNSRSERIFNARRSFW